MPTAKTLKSYKIVLESASPRRRDLLKTLIPDFTVSVSEAAEITGGTYPARLVQLNAKSKAKASSEKDAIVIAADTVVYYNGSYFLKPKSEDEAFNMLKTLAAHTHFVYTGVCIRQGRKLLTFYDKSAVTFKAVGDDEIRNYIKSERPLDKAGAYGIQDNVVVQSYEGSYSNIMGLPLEKLAEKLRVLGIVG